MADITDLSTISKLQFHYWFSDKTHSMDALIHNKCEREILEIARLVAKLCGVAITMETEPSGKGGLKNWLTLAAKLPKKTPQVKVAMVHTLVAAFMVSAGLESIRQTIDRLLDSLLVAGEAEPTPQLIDQLAQLRIAIASHLPLLDENGAIKKRRSNFYELLGKYPKVKSVSVAFTDGGKKPLTEEQLVLRDRFKAFKVNAGVVTRQVIEHASVAIISPVLVQGNHKWKGAYNGTPISFVMKSDEFIAMIQSGKVEFKSGSSITCKLEIEKKTNSAGVEKIVGYNIIGVGSYSENGKTTETPDTKQKHKESALSKKQLDLFG